MLAALTFAGKVAMASLPKIYEYAWGDDFFVADNNIMVAISKLRTKLDEDPSRYIKTLRGLGYRLEA